MYPIEVISASSDLLPAVERAMGSLNSIQREFSFHRPHPTSEHRASELRGLAHNSNELFQWLQQYRDAAGGHKPFLVLIVEGQLATPRYANAFGSHRASSGMAVFTVHDQVRFVADAVRYLRYYLVRYAISFVNSSLRNHDDTRGCFFDRKEYKHDIQASMKSGALCDEHRDQLYRGLAPEVREALEILAKRVSEDLPYALVMKGGGVKGLAFMGALQVLGDCLSFDEFAGTSAGAIAAVLLAAGYSAAELEVELGRLDFRQFCDRGVLRTLKNLLVYRALHRGERIQEWMEEQLATRPRLSALPSPIRMSDLEARAVVYACSAHGLLSFDNRGERQAVSASFAVRCSAAIPYYFESPIVDGVKAFDGGLRQNFPLRNFMDENPAKPVIGLYLLPSRGGTWWSRFSLKQLVDSVTTGEEPDTVRRHRTQIVPIDPSPIRTTDFALDDVGKRLLLSAGRLAALRYLAEYLPDEAPGSGELEAEESRLSELRGRFKSGGH